MNHVVSPLLDKPKVFLQTHWGRMQGAPSQHIVDCLPGMEHQLQLSMFGKVLNPAQDIG
jgi:hypothetical protein